MFVDKIGFDQIDELLIAEKDKLKEVTKQKAEAFQNDTNTWHDNAAYDAALERENECYAEINRLIDFKLKAQIVEKHHIPDMVDIGDKVTIKMDDDEIFEVALTGKFAADNRNGEITLNSPLGESIYKKMVNEKIKYRSHGNTACVVEILKIVRDYEN